MSNANMLLILRQLFYLFLADRLVRGNALLLITTLWAGSLTCQLLQHVVRSATNRRLKSKLFLFHTAGISGKLDQTLLARANVDHITGGISVMIVVFSILYVTFSLSHLGPHFPS